MPGFTAFMLGFGLFIPIDGPALPLGLAWTEGLGAARLKATHHWVARREGSRTSRLLRFQVLR